MPKTFCTRCTVFFQSLSMALIVLLAPLVAAEDARVPMVFLQFDDPEFRAGLKQHDMLDEAGFRLHNTGYNTAPFGVRWEGASLLAEAKASGRPYYIDRITGGMPYQSLEGIGGIATSLKDDPNFLGFQVHEWGNSPTHDYHRIHKLILDKDLPLDANSFADFEGRIETPYFSGGDFSIYGDLYTELKTKEEVEAFLTAYFKKIVALTEGQVMSVTGHAQLHHTALRLGAKNVMAEIGNQVPLTAFQIASARGAGRQHGKPFGAYYETWGGSPMGCICATDFSPWFPNDPQIKAKMDGYNVGPQHGSSRSLQRRLLYYAWLSGAAWWSEEWGAENYFSNWSEYPITEYGRIIQDFQRVTDGMERPEPIVPVAVVMPPETFGVDIRYVAGTTDTLWRIAKGPDRFHNLLRRFGKSFLATQSGGGGRDAHNLTPSPWIGSFDIVDADVSEDLLSEYACAVYFNEGQSIPASNIVLFDTSQEANQRIANAIGETWSYRVDGKIGAAHARANGRYLLGLFNNRGITKTSEEEHADPEATQSVTVHGNAEGMKVLVGESYVTEKDAEKIQLVIPAGEVVLLSFAE